MKKAVIAYLLAVLIISFIGLSVDITVADNPEPGDGDGGKHTQDENGGGLHSSDDGPSNGGSLGDKEKSQPCMITYRYY